MTDRIAGRGFSVPLRIALWAAPLLACGAWLAQWFWRFPPRSFGSSVTAKLLVLGILLGATSALFACYRLVRKSTARTGEAYALAGVNIALLLAALLLLVAAISDA